MKKLSTKGHGQVCDFGIKRQCTRNSSMAYQ